MRAKRGKSAVAVAMALLLVSCGTTLHKPSVEEAQFIPPEVRLSDIVRECQTKADTVKVLEWEAIFQIIDPDFCKNKLLFPTPNRETFFARIEAYTDGLGQEKWDQIISRRELARLVCKTPIYQPKDTRDIRWELYLLYGCPSVEWVSKGEILKPGTFIDGNPCDYYTFTWDVREKEIVCRSGLEGGYPIEIAPKESRDRNNLGTWIKSYLYFAAFPNADGTFDLWVCTQITADQLTEETLIKGELFFELKVSDQAGQLVGRDTLRANIALIRAMVGIAKDNENAALSHLGCRCLAPGNYSVEVNIQGEGNNGGHYVKHIPLPSPNSSRGTSDLLLVLPGIMPQPNVAPGIIRGKKELYGKALLVFSKWSDIYPYWEIDLPSDSAFQYRVKALLVPMPVKNKGKGNVILYGISYIEDTVGHPWMNSSPPTELLEKKPKKKVTTGRHGDICTLLDKTFRRTDNPTGVFDTPLSLRMVKGGRSYWLIVRVSDPEEKYYFRTVWLPIEVR